jgi:hypothetical protein
VKESSTWRKQDYAYMLIWSAQLTTSNSQCKGISLQVAAVAVNSGLVTFPVSYSVAYKTSGLTIWNPEPPAGYAALGCVANPGDDPPALTEVACIATGIGERTAHGCKCKGLPWR